MRNHKNGSVTRGWMSNFIAVGKQLQFNSIQKIICIALPYRISITGGPAQFSIYLESQEKYAFLNK